MPSVLTRALGWLTTKAAPPAGTVPVRGSLWGWVQEPSAGAWQRGVTIDPLASVVSFSPVYACVTRIANDIAKLGLNLLEQQADGTRTPAVSASPYWQTLRRPNTFQNRIQFVSAWLVSKLLYGNAYGLKVRDGRGIVVAVYLLDPRRVTPMVTPAGDVYYSLGGDDLARVPAGWVAPATEIIHDRMNCLWHPLVGVAPIYACALSATQGMRIQTNSATFFENMSRPSGILTVPGNMGEADIKRVKTDWDANYSAGSLGKLAVMTGGATYAPMAVPAEQSQMVEQLGWTVEDVARAFCMPLYKVGAGPMPTNNNVQALNQQYLDDCLQVYIEAIELCLDEGLGVPAGYGVEFDIAGLLRMDSATQIDVLTKGVAGGVFTPNEARAGVNMKPLTGGDTVYLQQQQYSMQALAKRDARDDPFAKDGGTPAPAPAAPAPPAPPPAKEVDVEAVVLNAVAQTTAAATALMREERAHLEQATAAVVERGHQAIEARFASLEDRAAEQAQAATGIDAAVTAAIARAMGDADDAAARGMAELADEIRACFALDDAEAAC